MIISPISLLVILIALTTPLRAQSGDFFDNGAPLVVPAAADECARVCARCPAIRRCPVGTRLVPDEGPCGCCKKCAPVRKLAERCDKHHPCAVGLRCRYAGLDMFEGVCIPRQQDAMQRSCFFDNKMYYSGETFVRGCNDRCQCHDGRLKCMPLCPQRISALAPKNCKVGKMVKKGCCVEWACSEAFDPALPVVTFPSPATSSRKLRPFGFASKPSSASTSNHKVRRHRERAAASQARNLVSVSAFHASALVHKKSRCEVQETEWSPCSKQCGWGQSYKWSNDNESCQRRRIQRFCQIRPCNTDLAPPANKKGKKCQRVVRAPRRVRFSYKGCRSRSFMPKYCGACVDGQRCCRPRHENTSEIEFVCRDGTTFTRLMMIVKSCECRKSACSSTNPFAAAS